MTGPLKVVGAAVLFAATASIAGAAPATLGLTPEGLSNDVIQVHGNHRSCERGPRGWHRHKRCNAVASGGLLQATTPSPSATSATDADGNAARPRRNGT